MNYSLLAQFGFTKNDIAVYQALVSLGTVKTGAIVQQAQIASSRAYASLDKLITHGLVSFQVKNNIRYYRAELPTRLLDEMEEQRNTMKELIKQIQQQATTKQKRNEVNMYEGVYGFKKAFEQHVDQCQKGEQLSIISFSPRLYDLKKLRNFFRHLDCDLVKKKLQVQFILDKKLQNSFGKDKKGIQNYSIRYMPTGYFNPAAVNISQREVLLSVWGEHPVAFSISNAVVISSFKQNFQFLWNLAAK
ncbi:MAG TPA: helix-turn-helix domain-containing protein [Patescibacteria group bacterium]|nr:helix-turn-helix domain-containing protein [Patescibacteria group bacterium]